VLGDFHKRADALPWCTLVPPGHSAYRKRAARGQLGLVGARLLIAAYSDNPRLVSLLGLKKCVQEVDMAGSQLDAATLQILAAVTNAHD
jgi:hypothetical protein